ncbi:MAG: HEPN domain-containing protein [Firmicutes bacterium]|nr:HEPN domain-containing protein [Bacillota bacterium]
MPLISYLEYSNRDMKYARDIFSLGDYDPCGRFCQQSVEKRLKYYIEQHGIPNDKRLLHLHSLTNLYQRVCELAGCQVDKKTKDDLHKLTDDYFNTNYPSKNDIELTEEMAIEAMEIAETVNSWLDSLLALRESEEIDI